MKYPMMTAEPFFTRHDRRIVIVSESGCWVWMGASFNTGYGEVKVAGQKMLAHRVAYEAAFGEIPDDLMVRHLCDVPPCVNPAHLSLGTQTDNMADMRSRNRQSKGEGRPLSILSDCDVRRIREMLIDGISQSQIAREFGVSQPKISRIKTRKAWSHVQ